MIYRCLIIFFTVILFKILCLGQTPNMEHLKQKINAAKTGDEKLEYILLLCEERQSLSTDTLFHYASEAKSLAALQNNQRNISLAEYDIAFCLSKREKADSALYIIEKILLLYKNDNHNKDLYLKFEMLKTRVLDRDNKPLETLAALYKLLNEAEQLKDTLTQIMAKTGIGWIQLEMKQYKEALGWFQNALHTSDNPKLLRNYGAVYSNIALVYNAMGKNDSAEIYIRRAIQLCRESETLTFLATSLNIQANIFINTGKQKAAEESLKVALSIREKINDPYYIIPDMVQLALFYANTGQTQQGITLCNNGIQFGRDKQLYSKLPELYSALAENYKAAGSNAKYAETLSALISLKDSIYTINSAQAVAEMQTKYDLQKKKCYYSTEA